MIPYEVTIYTGDVEHAGCDCDVSLKLFGTSGAPSEHVIKKREGMFERGSIDPFQVQQRDRSLTRKFRSFCLVRVGRRGRADQITCDHRASIEEGSQSLVLGKDRARQAHEVEPAAREILLRSQRLDLA